jgi:nucleoside-diphosphate-sugar epimerase
MTGNKKVFLTGVTGFIGSNIARELIRNGYKICGLRRNASSTSRISDIVNEIVLLNADESSWIEQLKKEKCDLLIHSAWEGISVKEREDWHLQMRNFDFSKNIFDLAVLSGVKKIISLGSQAEYGLFEKKISEDSIANPVDAYGAVKLLTMNYLHFLANKMNIEWYWLRIFSVFGRGENKNWLIPHVVNCLRNSIAIDLTEGKQRYDYIYTDDFVKNLMKVVECNSDKSGIYNLCSGSGIEIRELIIFISQMFPGSQYLINFGKVPYRENQNMYLVGDNTKFETEFGKMHIENLQSSLMKIINSDF